MRGLVLVWLLASCAQSDSILCDNGRTCPAKQMCDDVHGGCIEEKQLAGCAGIADGTACMIAQPDDAICDQGVCLAKRCGDGYLSGSEVCDGDQFGALKTCSQVGFYEDEALGCTANCELDETMCSLQCGDGVVTEPQELCDNSIPSASCVDFGYGAGNLACSANCGPGFDDCIPFGWRTIGMPGTVRALHGTSSTNVWVVGDAGMVQRFDGTTWSAIDVTACTTDQIRDVFVLSQTDAFLRAGADMIRVTASGCTKATVTDLDGGNEPAIWASSIDDAYAGGSNGLWHFRQGTWTMVDANATTTIWGSGPGDVYAFSQAADMRHFDGQSWTAPANFEGMSEIIGSWGTNATDIYVAGSDAAGASVKHSSANGWEEIMGPLPMFADGGIAGRGATAGGRTYVLALYIKTGTFLAAVVARDGTSWVNTDAPLLIGSTPFVTETGRVYMAAPGTDTIYVFDGAALHETPVPPFAPVELAVKSPSESFIVTSGGFGAGDAWAWNGGTWTKELSGTANDVIVTPGGEVFEVGNGFLRQRTGPGAWTQVTAGFGGKRLSGTSPTDLWGVTIAPQAISHWTGTVQNYSLSFTVWAIWAASPTLAFAVGDGGKIAHWNGTSWNEAIASPTTIILNNVWGRSATDVYAWSVGEIIHYDGTAWSKIAMQPPETNIAGVWGTSLDDLFVAGETGLHHFDGQRWTPVATGDTYPVRGIDGSGNTLYLITLSETNQILRTRSW